MNVADGSSRLRLKVKSFYHCNQSTLELHWNQIETTSLRLSWSGSSGLQPSAIVALSPKHTAVRGKTPSEFNSNKLHNLTHL